MSRFRTAGLALIAAVASLAGATGIDSSTGAQQLPTKGPFVQQGAKLTARDQVIAVGYEHGNFGSSAALSAHGTTALVGGYGDTKNKGAVWVFNRAGSAWKQQGPKLAANNEVGGGQFGSTVALSGDGKTALVGGVSDNLGVGAAWVFSRSGSTWKQQAKLYGSKPGATSQYGFGVSVALAADGGTALVGASAYNDAVGAAFVYKRSGSSWIRSGKMLTGKREIGQAEFGASVALSADGKTAVIGGTNERQGAGAAWVFTRTGLTWTQQGSKLTAQGERGSGSFGCSAALSGDGNVAVISACTDNGYAGAAWVFTRSGSTWTQGPRLTPVGADSRALFGFRVALSSDGRTALVGGYGHNASRGAAWLFNHSGSGWTQLGPSLTGPGASGAASFGYSVALSADGKVVLVGGPSDHGGIGAAWVKAER
jgi:hypothetical protein